MITNALPLFYGSQCISLIRLCLMMWLLSTFNDTLHSDFIIRIIYEDLKILTITKTDSQMLSSCQCKIRTNGSFVTAVFWLSLRRRNIGELAWTWRVHAFLRLFFFFSHHILSLSHAHSKLTSISSHLYFNTLLHFPYTSVHLCSTMVTLKSG